MILLPSKVLQKTLNIWLEFLVKTPELLKIKISKIRKIRKNNDLYNQNSV